MDPFRALADLLAPPRCASCAARCRPPWCEACDRSVVRVHPEAACPRCGLPGGDELDGHPCWAPGAAVDRSVVAFDYRGPVADAIVAGKASGLTSVWPALGGRLAAHLRAAAVTADVVAPVPTDPGRRRQRGVDHTRVLADAVGRGLDLAVRDLLVVGVSLPDRGSRATVGRRELPPGAFVPTRRISGVTVLLVDDVVTTGATAEAAAVGLRRAGCRRVVLATVARAGRHRLATPGARQTARV